MSLTCGSSGGGSNRCRGDVIVVRYADDFVIGFENHSEATACLEELRTRFAKFGLKLHEGKTRLIEFGRYAIERRATTWREPTGNFRFSWLHAQVCQDAKEGLVHDPSPLDGETHACHIPSDQGKPATSECIDRLAKRVDGCGVLYKGWLNYHAVPQQQPPHRPFRRAR